MSPQRTIAHYRITSKLGEGGMGAFAPAIGRPKLRRCSIAPPVTRHMPKVQVVVPACVIMKHRSVP